MFLRSSYFLTTFTEFAAWENDRRKVNADFCNLEYACRPFAVPECSQWGNFQVAWDIEERTWKFQGTNYGAIALACTLPLLGLRLGLWLALA